jgi:hypothetical protein
MNQFRACKDKLACSKAVSSAFPINCHNTAVAEAEPTRPLGLLRTRSPDPQREFADEFSIYQAPSLAMVFQIFGILDAHALLYDERITLVGSQLLVERCNTPATAICNDVANPMRIQRARSATAFTARYWPVRQRAVFRQPQRPKRRLVRNEFNQGRDVLQVLPPLIKMRLVPRWSRQDHPWPPTLARLSSLMALWHT